MSEDDIPRRASAAEAVRKRARGILGLIVDPLVAVLARLGVSPNMVSVGGFLITAAAAWPLAEGRFLLGGLLLLGGSATDMLDGALARATGRVSKRGGLLDSTLDPRLRGRRPLRPALLLRRRRRHRGGAARLPHPRRLRARELRQGPRRRARPGVQRWPRHAARAYRPPQRRPYRRPGHHLPLHRRRRQLPHRRPPLPPRLETSRRTTVSACARALSQSLPTGAFA